MVLDEEEEQANPESTTSTTVNTKTYLSNYSTVSMYDHAPIRRNRKKLLGFCESPECLSGNVIKYRADGRTRALITDDVKINECPRCKHALFWSKNYQPR